MRFKKYGGAAKAVAVLLFLLSLLTAFWSLLGVAYMVQQGYYNTSYTFYNTELCQRVTQDYANSAFRGYLPLTQKTALQWDEAAELEAYRYQFSPDRTNFIFSITDENGNVVLTNTDAQTIGYPQAYRQVYSYSGVMNLPEMRYTMTCFVRQPLTLQDNYSQPYQTFETLYGMRYTLIVLAAVSPLLSLGLFMYMMLAAGRRDNGSEIVTTWQHRIPADISTTIFILICYVTVEVPRSFNLSAFLDYGFALMLPVSLVACGFSIAALIWCMNIAVQLKAGIIWRNLLIVRIVSFIWRILGKLFGLLPMIWKSALLFAGYLFINGTLTILAFQRGSPTIVMLLLLFNGVVFLGLCFMAGQMRTLKRAGERIAAGDYAFKIDTAPLSWDLKRHGENLNNIVAGMSCAVEERLKSERLKTELITNVSHDLKTPLTSIVNYIDLLKKEQLHNETAEGYVAVLDRQSSRLRKLTEDLLEASKAATGNVSLSLGRIDLVELLNQSVGEYAGRFEEGRLETVFQSNNDKTAVYADGRLLWRIFDNLLNNICKYSLAGTRVYITADAGAETTTVTLRNISRDPLNIAPDELLERFVRGDASRSTEGSGLGLSIARSLTELLGGSFALMLEGDLFKTVLTFKTLV